MSSAVIGMPVLWMEVFDESGLVDDHNYQPHTHEASGDDTTAEAWALDFSTYLELRRTLDLNAGDLCSSSPLPCALGGREPYRNGWANLAMAVAARWPYR